MPEKKFLSIVLAVRNDNYGGDFNFRLQNMIRWNAHFLEQEKVDCEFILVNYNSIPDQGQLNEVISFPSGLKFVTFRMITVPPAFHASVSDPEIRKPVPLYEYIAKNIGIRRAAGEFILSANPDILLDPGIIRFLAKKKLSKGEYYRCDRADFKRWDTYDPVPGKFSLAEIRKRAFRLFLKGHTLDLANGNLSALRLWWLRRKNERSIRRNFWLIEHFVYANQRSIPINFDNLVHRFHCNCSGDFMLMHRDAWFSLRAHPEKTFLAIHTDALFVVQAAMSGLKEVVLPWLIFHQDHERRYGADREKQNEEEHKMFRWFIREGEAMRRDGKTHLFNPPDWGFESWQFEEHKI